MLRHDIIPKGQLSKLVVIALTLLIGTSSVALAQDEDPETEQVAPEEVQQEPGTEAEPQEMAPVEGEQQIESSDNQEWAIVDLDPEFDDGLIEEDDNGDGQLDRDDQDSADRLLPAKLQIVEPVAAPRGQMVPRSLGGERVLDRQAPWQAQIYAVEPPERYLPEARVGRADWELPHRCGGSLIAEGWILTAAHCINDAQVARGYRVRLGVENFRYDKGETYKIVRQIRYPNATLYNGDIALVQIVEDHPQPKLGQGQVRKIRPQSLSDAPLAGGQPISVTGWGKTKAVVQDQASAILLRIDLKAQSPQDCLAKLGARKGHAAVICAASPTDKTCGGDSGGPVVEMRGGEAVQVGIVSWGSEECENNGHPSVFTRVANYQAWINKMIAPARANWIGSANQQAAR
jgi:Trypsin